MTGLFPWGIHGPGMDQYVRDEAELGGRVACGLDAENNWDDLPGLLHDLMPGKPRQAERELEAEAG
jgi:hypothetical protein